MLTLPNILTLSRIFAVPLLVFLLWKPSWFDYAITFGLYCLVGITDYFDGYLARAQGAVSRLGIFLDPIADKIMVAAVIIMLVSTRKASGEPVIHDLHIIAAGVIRIGINPNFPNMSVRNSAGEWEGFDIEVGKALATAIGVEIE